MVDCDKCLSLARYDKLAKELVRRLKVLEAENRALVACKPRLIVSIDGNCYEYREVR